MNDFVIIFSIIYVDIEIILKLLLKLKSLLFMKVDEACQSLVLYSVELKVSNVEVVHQGNEKIVANSIEELTDDERVEFIMEKPVPKG